MECPYCGTDNRDGVRFCSNCGKPMTPMTTSPTIPASSSTGGSGSSSTGNSRSLTPGSRVQGGRYVIKKILGQGGMGAALLATDLRLDSKPVVIKELISDNTDPTKLQEDVRNFKREVATLAHIDHPLVPNVTDHFQEGSRYFMVQEYVEGENLEELMDRVNQPMKEREALGYASEVLDILDYLAQQTPPVVHRDIKPANIIIGAKDKRAHLVDFGIARADVARNAKRKQTSALGTPGYAPPEQYQGNADPRSDLYALAATMHHLLTNRDPRNHPPFTYPPVRTLNPQISAELERVLIRALTNDMSQRYQSATAMKKDIDDILLKRFGVSGNISSYTLGTSGPMTALSGPSNPATTSSAPTMLGQQLQQRPVTPLPTPPPGGGWQSYQQPPIRPVPPTPIRPAQRQPQRQGHIIRNSFIILLIVLLIVVGLFAYPYIRSRLANQGNGTPAATATVSVGSNGIGVVKAADGEMIGISDGTASFDVNRVDGALKAQASAKLKAGDTVGAQSLWRSAVASDTSDAESLIYLENQQVLNTHAISGNPYITIVIATMLTGDNAAVGRDDLQGAYVAQKEFNDGAKLSGSTLIRLLVASSGNQSSYAPTVANEIVQLQKSDSTFVGVMGWPFSSRTAQVLKILAQAHIPMISQTASSDALTNASPYFFRVAPTNKEQGITGAHYSETVLHANVAALFVDNADPYSQTLGLDFSRQFSADGNQVFTEPYTIGEQGHSAFNQLLTTACSHTPAPNVIYFSGYAADLGALLTDLPNSGPCATIPIMGGDALYELGGYPTSASRGFTHTHFTTFAYPDEWDVLKLQSQKPLFFSEYGFDFNPNNQHGSGSYGYGRADGDALLSYDAMQALLTATNNLLTANKHLTGDNLRLALLKITGPNAIQGVAGQISFDKNGDPINKAFGIIHVDSLGRTGLETVQGCFLVGACSSGS